jgi:hypothetical protein
MTKDEALDLALETLRSAAGELYRVTSYCDTYDALAKTNNAIIDIQQARSAPVQKRPQNCGTGYCSCVECVMEPAPVQEPIGYLFQHEENGLTMVFDVQQVEWGFKKNNPRHQKIGPVYTTPPAAQRQCEGCDKIAKP